MKLLREQGYQPWIVEYWCSFTRRRKDLFGIIDILAVKEGETLAVQTTSGSAVSARVKKIQESEAIEWVRDAGWNIHIHGWRKLVLKRGGKAMRWKCRIVDLTSPEPKSIEPNNE